MKNFITTLIAVGALVGSQPITAQSLKDGQPTLKTGNWTVLQSTDAMTDKVSCTGIYKASYGIQLVQDALYVKIAGGIQSILSASATTRLSPCDFLRRWRRTSER